MGPRRRPRVAQRRPRDPRRAAPAAGRDRARRRRGRAARRGQGRQPGGGGRRGRRRRRRWSGAVGDDDGRRAPTSRACAARGIDVSAVRVAGRPDRAPAWSSSSTTTARTPSSSSPAPTTSATSRVAGRRPARSRRRAARPARGAASRRGRGRERRASGRGARVVINIAPYAALPPDVVGLADPVVVNEHEMRSARGLRRRAAVAARDVRRQGGDVGRRDPRPSRWPPTRWLTPPAPATRSAGPSRQPSRPTWRGAGGRPPRWPSRRARRQAVRHSGRPARRRPEALTR